MLKTCQTQSPTGCNVKYKNSNSHPAAEAVLFESISCFDNVVLQAALMQLGEKISLAYPKVKPYRLHDVKTVRDHGMYIQIMSSSIRRCRQLVCCFTYGFCLCSRRGRRAAPGQNCRATCLNRSKGSYWNVAVVTTGPQMVTSGTGEQFVKKILC